MKEERKGQNLEIAFRSKKGVRDSLGLTGGSPEVARG